MSSIGHSTDSRYINAREQSGERDQSEAIPALGLPHHHPDLQHASTNTRPANRQAPVAVSTPAKKQKLGKNNENKKNRMMGKKGEDEGFIPNWERMQPYAMSTLRNKVASTKIIRYLEAQGVDISQEFPTIDITYNGKKTTRAEAMAMRAQELHQANIDRKNAGAQLSATAHDLSREPLRNVSPMPNDQGVISTTGGGDSEVEVLNAVESQSEVGSQNEAVFQREASSDQNMNVGVENLRGSNAYDNRPAGAHNINSEDSEPTIVSYTRAALRTLKEAASKSSSNSPELVYDDSMHPIISFKAQWAIFRLIGRENNKLVFEREAVDRSLHVCHQLLPKKGHNACQADRYKVAGELAQDFYREGGVANWGMAVAMAKKLIDEEFGPNI
ncbi:hypothetical protein DPSP01_003729 [Paraphaeosphaeria sporulosa]